MATNPHSKDFFAMNDLENHKQKRPRGERVCGRGRQPATCAESVAGHRVEGDRCNVVFHTLGRLEETAFKRVPRLKQAFFAVRSLRVQAVVTSRSCSMWEANASQ